MEYVAGVTLDHLVEQQGPLSVAQACDYMRQAALGLQHAFEQGLVHRDIKPSNLMVTRQAGLFAGAATKAGTSVSTSRKTDGIVKILDMGIARVSQVSPADSLSTLTQTGAVIGTADYIAPEQLEDPRGADIRADLYSLGCTFYQLLTGQVPFPGGSLIQKLDRQRWETSPGIEQFRADVPASVIAIVRKLMAKKPADRYQTPGALAGALATLAKAEYASAEPAAAPLREVRRFVGHADAVWAVAFSPDGRCIASGGKDRSLRLWDVEQGAEVRRIGEHVQEIRALAFSAHGDRIVAAAGVAPRLWDVHSGEERGRCTGHTSAVRTIAFSPDGTRLVSGGDDKTARVWDAASGREVQRFTRHTAGITGVAVTPDGSQVVSASRDQSLRLWDIRTGQELRHFAVPRGMVLSVAVSPDGRHVLSAHFDTVLRLWDLVSGRELRRFLGHKQMVTAGAFTPDGLCVVSASLDHTVRLWDVESGSEISSSPGQQGGVHTVAVSPDGRRALSGSADGGLHLWQLPDRGAE
jgi:WD40 repeat protein